VHVFWVARVLGRVQTDVSMWWGRTAFCSCRCFRFAFLVGRVWVRFVSSGCSRGGAALPTVLDYSSGGWWARAGVGVVCGSSRRGTLCRKAGIGERLRGLTSTFPAGCSLFDPPPPPLHTSPVRCDHAWVRSE